jgi:hypothetical protein
MLFGGNRHAIELVGNRYELEYDEQNALEFWTDCGCYYLGGAVVRILV